VVKLTSTAREEGAAALLEAMSPDVRALVEYDTKFRLHSVIKQAADQQQIRRYLQSIFALQVQALAEAKTVDERRPEWGTW
jgi:hypothetical protein